MVGSPCPPSRSAHVFNAILNIKILLNGKNMFIKLHGHEFLVKTVGNSCTA